MERPTAEGLFRRHHLTIFRFALRMTGNAALAEDVTQDLFVRVVRGLETYDPRERDLAWLFRIARRLLADRDRARSRRPILVSDEGTELAAAAVDPLLAAGLADALRLVPDPEREAFLLREQAGFGYDEIAAIAGATPDAVRSRIHRARCRLREILAPRRNGQGATDRKENSR